MMKLAFTLAYYVVLVLFSQKTLANSSSHTDSFFNRLMNLKRIYSRNDQLLQVGRLIRTGQVLNAVFAGQELPQRVSQT